MADETTEVPTPFLSLQELRNAAELLEREAVALHRVTDAELDGRRPAVDVPAAQLAAAWFAYACWLSERKGGATAPTTRSLAQVMHESLVDEPVLVTCARGHVARVHPKSITTLLVLEGIDAGLRALLAQLDAVRGDDVPPELIANAELAFRLIESSSLRHFVWILDHPGPGLPFALHATEQPEPPAWTEELQASDVEQIWLAHLQVNRRDIEFLAAAFPIERQAQHARLPLSGFLGSKADEDGVKPTVYLNDRTTRSVFAALIARAETHRAAMAQARAGAERA